MIQYVIHSVWLHIQYGDPFSMQSIQYAIHYVCDFSSMVIYSGDLFRSILIYSVWLPIQSGDPFSMQSIQYGTP